MKRVLITLFGIALVAGLSIGPALAHHGRGQTYESTKEISIKGVVKQVAWRNPHIGIQIDVKGADGKVTTWNIEHSNVSTLSRLGYGRLTLQPGMEVTAVINPGTGGVPVGLCRKIILADGKEIFIRGANADPLD